MTGAFTLAGWHFSRNPTSSSSEHNVSMAPNSEPWKTEGGGKYQYHPGGDTSKRRDAPSALNEVVIPNVNLPKVCGLFSFLRLCEGEDRGYGELGNDCVEWECVE